MIRCRDADENADVSANVDADAIFALMLITPNSAGGMQAMHACDDVVDNAMLCAEALGNSSLGVPFAELCSKRWQCRCCVLSCVRL